MCLTMNIDIPSIVKHICRKGTLYPALQRLERRGLITAEWGTSENNRRARYYRLTTAGRKQLTTETGKWERLTEAIARIINPDREEA